MVRTGADFNGDGQEDLATVLAHVLNPDRAGVFVFLSSSGKPMATKIDEYTFASEEYMLVPVKKGCYKSETRKVCLRHDGILRTEIEYGWGTLYWLHGENWKRMGITRGEFPGL